jgi:hypothetical protein
MHMLRRSISCMLAGVLAVFPAVTLLYGLLGYWMPGHAFAALSMLFAWVPGHAFAALSMLFASVAGVIWLYDEVAEILRGSARP